MKNKLLTGLFLLTICNLPAQEEFSLKLQKSGSYCITMTNKVTIVQTVNGKDIQTINTEKGAFCYKVLEDLDSAYLVETAFTHLSQQLETPEDTTFYSSDKPSENVTMSILLSKILNKPFLVWMQKDYTWIKTQGLDSVFLNTFKNYNLPLATRKYLDSTIIEMVKGFSRFDADLTAVLYDSNQKIPGAVWTTSVFSEHVIPTFDSSTYYLTETGGDLLEVTGTGVVTSTLDPTTNGFETTWYDLTGTNKFFVSVFKNSFWINSGSLSTELEGISIIKDTQKEEIRHIPIKIKTEANIEGYKL